MLETDTAASALPAPARRRVLLASAIAVVGFSMARTKAAAAPAPGAAAIQLPAKDGISRMAASIHQEPVFTANRERLYKALTNAGQFERVVQLSAAMQGRSPTVPATISDAQGGPFSLFGGYITGRQVELLPDELIVQAWRSESWRAGIYSIARFQLVDNGSGSRIIFDHGGFPNDEAEHLAAGWQANYWTPLAKWLSQ